MRLSVWWAIALGVVYVLVYVVASAAVLLRQAGVQMRKQGNFIEVVSVPAWWWALLVGPPVLLVVLSLWH